MSCRRKLNRNDIFPWMTVEGRCNTIYQSKSRANKLTINNNNFWRKKMKTLITIFTMIFLFAAFAAAQDVAITD